MRTLSVLLLLLVIGSCTCGAGPRAKRAIDDARAAGAETYAPSELKRATAALAEAARSDEADRDRLYEAARASAERAGQRATSLRARVTSLRAQHDDVTGARDAESKASAEVVLASARASVAEEAPLPEGVGTTTATRAAELAFHRGALLLDVQPASVARERARGSAAAPPLVLEHTRWPTDAELLLLGSGVGTVDVATAAGTLLRRDYKKITVVSGGMLAWQAAGLPLDGSAAATDVPVIEVKELAAASRSDVVIVDVREQRSYAAGHLPGAVHIAPEQLEQAAATQLAGHRVVVYAASDDAGRRAAERLVKAGHRDVRRLLGGAVAWARAGQRFDAAPPPSLKLARHDDIVPPHSDARAHGDARPDSEVRP